MCELGSRRHVEQLVLEKRVSVNGQVITNLATQVNENDIVLVNNKPVTPQTNKVYLMLNKPKGYLSSAVSQNGKPSVLSLVNTAEKVYPVGRLDFNTEGLLLLTNDGEFANKIIHPKNKIKKTYEVIVKGKPTDQQLQTLRAPMEIDGYTIAPAIVKNVKRYTSNTSVLQVVIHEGRNRQIRKMFEQVQMQILQLTRIQIGQLKLNDVKLGQCVVLQDSDISKIFK